MLTVTKRYEFEACHHLPNYVGPCHNLHGHSYKAEVTVGGTQFSDGEKKGMIIDFKDLKEIIKDTIGKYDHSNLNDFFDNPTAENMVRKMAIDIKQELNDYPNATLKSVRLWETASSYAEYTD